jgi:hypothetical protein
MVYGSVDHFPYSGAVPEELGTRTGAALPESGEEIPPPQPIRAESIKSTLTGERSARVLAKVFIVMVFVSPRNAYFNATVSVEGGESRVMLGKNGVTSKGIFSWGERRATGLTCIISS